MNKLNKKIWAFSMLLIFIFSSLFVLLLYVIEPESFIKKYSQYPKGLEMSIFISLFYVGCQFILTFLYVIPIKKKLTHILLLVTIPLLLLVNSCTVKIPLLITCILLTTLIITNLTLAFYINSKKA